MSDGMWCAPAYTKQRVHRYLTLDMTHGSKAFVYGNREWHKAVATLMCAFLWFYLLFFGNKNVVAVAILKKQKSPSYHPPYWCVRFLRLLVPPASRATVFHILCSMSLRLALRTFFVSRARLGNNRPCCQRQQVLRTPCRDSIFYLIYCQSTTCLA